MAPPAKEPYTRSSPATLLWTVSLALGRAGTSVTSLVMEGRCSGRGRLF